MCTLQERCFSAISKQIPKQNKGLFLADYISKTPKNLHSTVIDDIIKGIEKQMADYTTAMMQITVPYITDDIIATMTIPGRDRENYYQKFDGISLYIIDSSIAIAEKLAISMEERYVNRVNEAHQEWYNNYHCSDDEYDDDFNYDNY